MKKFTLELTAAKFRERNGVGQDWTSQCKGISGYLKKRGWLLLLAILFLSTASIGQVSRFDVRGGWSGNDANGNAVIKWTIEICAGGTAVTNINVTVPNNETTECQTGNGDEDEPDDNQVCGGQWNNPGNSGSTQQGNFCAGPGDWDSFRPGNYKTSGVLASGARLCPNTCARYTWVSYSKDYDSNGSDRDHKTVSNYTSSAGSGSDQADVSTNNYEQILGLGHELWDGPNLHKEGYWDMTWAYVACHHGESDYYQDYETTAPGGHVGADDPDPLYDRNITPDNVRNIHIESRIVDVLESRQGEVDSIMLTVASSGTYLMADVTWDGDGQPILTLDNSNLDPGQKETLGNPRAAECGTHMLRDILTCSDPFCDTIFVKFIWTPMDIRDMFNSGSRTSSLSLTNCRDYWHSAQIIGDYIPASGCQDVGSSNGADCNPPNEVSTSNTDHRNLSWDVTNPPYRSDPDYLKPDPEYGDGPNCHASGGGGNTDFRTCSAGPAEDCSSAVLEMCYDGDIEVTKTTLSVEPSPEPGLFDMRFEILVVNTGEMVQMANLSLTDDLADMFGAGVGTAYVLPFPEPPTVDMSVVPSGCRADEGFPSINPNFDGDTDTEIIDQTIQLSGPGTPTTMGVIDPGDTLRITMTVRTIFSFIGTDEYINEVDVESTDPNDVFDRTDSDTALAEIDAFFDLALKKRISSAPPHYAGENVTFQITVFNQGILDAEDVVVTDYIPNGLLLVPAMGWSEVAGNAVLDNPIDIAIMDSVNIDITFRIDPNFKGDLVRNWAEISDATNELDLPDIDSEPDNTNFNQDGETDDLDDDNVIDESGLAGGDEDDHDPAEIEVDRYDLALKKTTDRTLPVKVGDVVTWDITIYNQGNKPVDNVKIVDHIPCGMEFATNPAWSQMADTGCFTFIGVILPGDSARTSVDLRILGGQTGDSTCFINEAEIGSFTDLNGGNPPDVDSTPDEDKNNDNDVTPGGPDDNELDEDARNNPGEDEDDNDVAMVDVYDLALNKKTVTAPPYRYGDVVEFEITVYNQGTMVADDIELIDYVPAGFTYLPTHPTNTGNSWTAVMTTLPMTTIVDPLTVGDSVKVRIALEVTPGSLASDRFVNFSEIVTSKDAEGNDMKNYDYDSSPDNNNGNDVGGNVNTTSDDHVDDDGDDTNGDGILDEDDHDPEDIEVFDLALKKELATPAPYAYNDLLKFDITVTNQGTMVAENIVISDDVPEGYSFDALNPLNIGWTAGSPNTYTITGPMNPGDEVVVSIYLTLEQVGDSDERSWINYAWIQSARDTLGGTPVDADSNMVTDAAHERDVLPEGDNDDELEEHYHPDGLPSDEDDHDPAEVSIFDLALVKVPAVNGPFTYGQSVPFEITVINQGNEEAHDIEIYDYVPNGFSYDAGMNFPTWSYTPDPVNIATTTLATTTSLKPGERLTVTIWLIVQPVTTGHEDAWTNRAEIKEAKNEDDEIAEDIDSTPDGTNGNDPGGDPDTPTDDQEDGDGTDDEDDEDPARIEVVDLALTKKVVTPGPYVYGQPIDFEIEVTNQGNVTIRNPEVTDYIPVGYSFDFGDNPNWTNTAPTVSTSVMGDLDPGQSDQVTITLNFEMTAGGQKDWINYAEITNIVDTTGTNRNDDEADSRPGSNGADENAVEPWDPEDDNITSIDKGGEEDDHDPAGIEVQDLAIFMLDDTDILPSYGSEVIFPIMVFNQGSVVNEGFTVTNYIPSGFEFDPNKNLGWVVVNDSTVTFTYPDDFLPSEQVDLELKLDAVPSKGENAWTNVIEISDDNPVSLLGASLVDVDSTPDQDENNDPGGQVETGSDDVVNGDGKNGGGAPGDQDPGTDEDDADPEVVRVFDLALKKELNETAPYVYGDVHEFEICVINQGNEPMTNVKIQDYIPEGYVYNAQSAQEGWSVIDADNVENTIERIEDCDTICIKLYLTFEMSNGGENAWINYSEITEMQDTNGVVRDDVDSNPASDGPGERAVKPWDPADNDTDSNDKGGEEDDHDPAGPEVFDLAVFMLDDTDILPSYGSEVVFPIMVLNQGNIPSDRFTLTNYIPSGFEFDAGKNTGWTQINDSTVTYTYDQTISPEEQVDLELKLDAVPSKGEDAWTNVIEISDDNPVSPSGSTLVDLDSTPDQDEGNDAGGAVETASDDVVDGDGKNGGGAPGDENPATDEDDADPEIVRVFDLALRKALLTPEPYFYGQDHEFEICVINQGNEPMTDVEISDYIPKGYTFNGGLSTGWTEVDDSTATYVIDRVEDCDTVCVSIWLTLEMTDGGSRDWINYSEITEMKDTTGVVRDDVDSTPGSDGDDERDVEPGDDEDDDTDSNDKGGEEDDHDPAGPDIYDLALIKTSQDMGPFGYGDIITMDFWVFNQGNLTATEVEITEYVPVGYDWVASNDGDWDYDDVSRKATLTSLIGSIEPGDSALVQVDLEIIQSYEVGAWDNFGEISDSKDPDGDPIDDIDSMPDDDPDNDQGGEPDSDDDDEKDEDGKNDPDGDEDDHDPHRPEIVDMALNKRVPGKELFYIPGDTVPFVITIYNQGNVPAANTLVKDYMPQGFIFNNTIPENMGWSDNAGTLEYTYGPTLNSQDSAKITLYLEVQIAAMPTLLDWTNYAEIGEIRDTTGTVRVDADSNPSSDADHERDVMDNDDGDDRDDVVTGDWKSNPNEDEDDHDPEKVEVTGALGDTVWKDLDGDGIQDPNEPGVEGVIITLYTCEGEFVKMDTTDENGFYLFDFLIPLESYYAVFDISPLNNPDCVFTFPNEGVNDSLDSDVNAAGVGPCTFIEPGERDSTYDAGLVQLASLGDYVWHDRDADGIQDGGDEEGIEGVIVRLYDADGNLVGVDTTDQDGLYFFDDLMPTEYYVEFEYMDMWSRSPANQGGNDARDSDVDDTNGPNTTRLIDLEPGDNDLTWDLGLYKCIPVGDFVWFDLNANGIQDRPENGINGVRVYIYDGSGNLVDQAVTKGDPRSASKDGYYKFCVDPGTYYITFERPGHLAQSMSFAGGDSEKDSDITNTVELYSTYYFTVRSGDMRCDIDGGFHSKATMGDRVWHDKNGNGIQDAGEPRVEGAMISAFNTNGEEIWSDQSDPNGEFLMDALSTGEYYLEVTPPAGFTFTIADQGGDDGIDSDVDGSNGPRTTALYRVTPGEHEPDVDAGLVDGFLPVELIEFNAVYRGEKVEVTWMTAVEINNEYYEVERRHESEDVYRVVGSVRAAGTVYTTQDYGYDDYDVSRTGVYYYRLRQVDTDGTEARSEVRTVEVMGGGYGVTLYPNPASTVVNVEMRVSQEGEARIELVDQLGRSLPEYTKTRELESGTTVEEIKIDNLAPGMYTVQVKIGDDIQRIRFTKM